MATGSVSMLGIGFNGQTALNADLIDKLKNADKEIMIKPMEKKLTKVYEQQADQEKLEAKLDEFYEAVSTFASESSYLKREIKNNSSSVVVTAESGTSKQNFTLRVDQLATNSVQQSKGYDSEDAIAFADRIEDTYLEIKLGGSNPTKIKLEHGMTLRDLKDAINEVGGEFTASILNVGGEDPYKLIIKSNKSGIDGELSFRYLDENSQPIEPKQDEAVYRSSADEKEEHVGDDDKKAVDFFGFSSVQEAKNARFLYNGIEVERSSNVVTDLVSGINIELKRVDPVDAYISVEQDTSKLKEDIQVFVDKYNELTKLIDDITKFDEKDGKHGSFLGDSRITAIKSDLNAILFSQNADGQSIMNLTRVKFDPNNEKGSSGAFAFDLTDKGELRFDKSTFDYALDKDPVAFERLLRGYSEIVPSQAIGVDVPTTNLRNALPVEDLKINGVAIPKIVYDSKQEGDMDLLKVAVEKINSVADRTGVTARINSSKTGIILNDTTGIGFTIGGENSAVLGLSNGTYIGQNKTKDGIFTSLKDRVQKINGVVGETTMKTLRNQLKSEVQNSTDEIQSVIDRLNKKYDVMAMQFSAYNKMISLYESSFNSIKMQIEQAAAKK